MTSPPDSQRPSEVHVTVLRSADYRGLQGRGAVVVPMAVVAVALALVLGAGGGSRAADATVGDPGAAGVAAAYGYPPSCLSVRISVDRAFARADFARATSCGIYSGFPTALFRRFDGEWHPVLYTFSYPCPVPSVPRAVQRELTLCR
jgi:hypothetical protein